MRPAFEPREQVNLFIRRTRVLPLYYCPSRQPIASPPPTPLPIDSVRFELRLCKKTLENFAAIDNGV